MSIIVIGIDLAKNIFAVHGVGENGPSAREDERSKRLMQRPGIGPITASALLASIGNGHAFKNGRQVAAWIGLTPGQHSSGGRARLGHITKAGDHYLRSLLVMGARAVLNSLGDKQDYFSCWARELGGVALWRRLSLE